MNIVHTYVSYAIWGFLHLNILSKTNVNQRNVLNIDSDNNIVNKLQLIKLKPFCYIHSFDFDFL